MSWAFNAFAGRAVGPAAPLEASPTHGSTFRTPCTSPEPIPSRLETVSRSPHASIAAGDGALSASYSGAGAHSSDVGVVRADAPVPVRTSDLFYFEVIITSAGAAGKIGVGFIPGLARLTKQPGWESGSFGYHGDDGRKYSGASTRGEAYASSFTTGDVVGAGIDWGAGSIFFTKNGECLGTAWPAPSAAVALSRRLYPAVGLHSPGEAVRLNFAGPFRYDVSARAAAAAAAARADLDKVLARAAAGEPPPAPGPPALDLVRDYLGHAGYARTLAALDAGGAPPPPPPLPADPTLAARAAVRAALARGDVSGAAAAAAAVPGIRSVAAVLSSPPAALFLAAQATIEALRAGDVGRAVELAKAGLGPFCEVDRSRFESYRTGRSLLRAGVASANGLAPFLGLPAPLDGWEAVVPQRVRPGSGDEEELADDSDECTHYSDSDLSTDDDDPSYKFELTHDAAAGAAAGRAAAAKAMARDVLSLAAYDLSPAAPASSAPPPQLARLLSQAQRDAAADALNAAVLQELKRARASVRPPGGSPPSDRAWAGPRTWPASRLESTLRAVGAAAAAELSSRPGAPFNLTDFLLPRPPGGVEARWAPLLAGAAVDVTDGGGSAKKKAKKSPGGGGGGGAHAASSAHRAQG